MSQEIPGRAKIESRKTNNAHTTNSKNDRIVVLCFNWCPHEDAHHVGAQIFAVF